MLEHGHPCFKAEISQLQIFETGNKLVANLYEGQNLTRPHYINEYTKK